MLGRLVKWLPVIGEDVIYGPHLSGYGLIRAARAEGRLILTRDRGLKHKHCRLSYLSTATITAINCAR